MGNKKGKSNPILAKYEEKAREKYITMSDGSILKVLQTEALKETRNGYTLFLLPGWSASVFAWDVVLLEAMKYFDISYFESREKYSSTLNMKTKTTLDRISDDLV